MIRHYVRRYSLYFLIFLSFVACHKFGKSLINQTFLKHYTKHYTQLNTTSHLTPDITVAELTLTNLLDGLEEFRTRSLSNPSIETFVFSYYPKPFFNLTSTYNATNTFLNRNSSFYSEIKKLFNVFSNVSYRCKKMHVFGGWSCGQRVDGAKFICLDHFQFSPKKNCLVYSFGIGHDFSFETSVADHGCEVMAFDDDALHNYRTKYYRRVYFFHVRLASKVTLTDVYYKPDDVWYTYIYRPLDNILSLANHSEAYIDILKIDIEGGEWTVFRDSICKDDILDRVSQLSIEAHLDVLFNLTLVTEDKLLTEFISYNAVYDCLSDHGFQLAAFIPNELRPTITIIHGLAIHVYSEQFWINTRFIPRGHPPEHQVHNRLWRISQELQIPQTPKANEPLV